MSLVVADDSGNGLDLARLHVRFQVNHWIVSTPNTLVARIYNLSDATTQRINDEFTLVELSAGYPGQYGRIFRGTIKQLRRGRESATDTYLDLFAADADIAHNWAVINRSLAAGWTPEQVRRACLQSFGGADPKVTDGKTTEGLGQNQAPRGSVYFGMTRETMQDLATTYRMNWNLNDNELNMIAESAYLPGDAVVINETTGMIGVPQQTQEGITVTTLLNPNVGAGMLVKINQADIAQYLKNNAPIGLSYTATDLPAFHTAADGLYKVLYVDHVGDTRGNEWETRLTCIESSGALYGTPSSVLNTTALGGP